MRIKKLFTVEKEEKITEKRLLQVLISSVCSMLLCMACLAGTTWAWFAVSIENENNEIRIPDSFTQNTDAETNTPTTAETTQAATEAATEEISPPADQTTAPQG